MISQDSFEKSDIKNDNINYGKFVCMELSSLVTFEKKIPTPNNLACGLQVNNNIDSNFRIQTDFITDTYIKALSINQYQYQLYPYTRYWSNCRI